MLGADTITFNPTMEAAIAAVGVGFAAFWSNPRRTVNRAIFAASLVVASWLFCLHNAIAGGSNGQLWMRFASAVGAYVPFQLWLIKESIASSGGRFLQMLWRGLPWLFTCCGLAAITLTDWFVTRESSRDLPGVRWGYYVYIFGVLAVYALLSRQTIQQMRAQTGANRLELQIMLLGGSTAAFAVVILMALRSVLHLPVLVRLQPLVVLIFYVVVVVGITTHRIFDARQILFVGLQKVSLILMASGAAYIVDIAFDTILPEPFALFATVAICLWLVASLNTWLGRFLHFYPEATAARQAAFAIARRETNADRLEKAFLGVIKGWGQTEHAILVSGAAGPLRGGGVVVPENSAALGALRQLRWATPERLVRERSTPERVALAKFLLENGLGAAVVGEGPTLTAIIGAGMPASRRPFTYPQITQLIELASIIENALERAHFSVKAQHAEQLATVGLLGASLAHEIRNPLVTIKTFVQLLPKHHQDPVFREKFFGLITDEVTRIDRLTEQLLDLASPRIYKAERVDLHPILRTSIELVAAKATDKRIEFLTELQAAPDTALTDASAAKQVLLNLCFNAIQAAEMRAGERWVKVSTRNVATGIEMTVEDSGPGVSPEIRPRLFQPFQSTKSSGFGLGLAICRDILVGLDATISVDPLVPGRGAVFRVIFPCPV